MRGITSTDRLFKKLYAAAIGNTNVVSRNRDVQSLITKTKALFESLNCEKEDKKNVFWYFKREIQLQLGVLVSFSVMSCRMQKDVPCVVLARITWMAYIRIKRAVCHVVFTDLCSSVMVAFSHSLRSECTKEVLQRSSQLSGSY